MPALHVSLPHQLAQTDALTRIKDLLDRIRTQHGDKVSHLQQEWNDNTGNFSFKVMGFEISGTLNVGVNSVDLNSEIPMPALLFKSKIVSIIEEEGRKILAPLAN